VCVCVCVTLCIVEVYQTAAEGAPPACPAIFWATAAHLARDAPSFAAVQLETCRSCKAGQAA